MVMVVELEKEVDLRSMQVIKLVGFIDCFYVGREREKRVKDN